MESRAGHAGSPNGPIFLKPCCYALWRPCPVPGGGSRTQLRANTRRVGVTSPLRTPRGLARFAAGVGGVHSPRHCPRPASSVRSLVH